jgi:hypothetical protein
MTSNIIVYGFIYFINSVSIVTELWAGQSRNSSLIFSREKRFFLLSKCSIQALGPTQARVQCVVWMMRGFPGDKAAGW